VYSVVCSVVYNTYTVTIWDERVKVKDIILLLVLDWLEKEDG